MSEESDLGAKLKTAERKMNHALMIACLATTALAASPAAAQSTASLPGSAAAAPVVQPDSSEKRKRAGEIIRQCFMRRSSSSLGLRIAC